LVYKTSKGGGKIMFNRKGADEVEEQINSETNGETQAPSQGAEDTPINGVEREAAGSEQQEKPNSEFEGKVLDLLQGLQNQFVEKIKFDDVQRSLMTEQKNRILQLESNDALKAQKHIMMSLLEVYDFVLAELDRLKSEPATKAYESLDGVKNICEVALENNSYNTVRPKGKFDSSRMMCSKVIATDKPEYDGVIYRVVKCGVEYANFGDKSAIRVPKVEVFKYSK
jgi:hypothetical protein